MKNNQSELFHSINQFSRHFSKALNERLVPLGIYSAQWTIIYLLKTWGPSTQKELSTYLGVEAPTMTRTLTRLETAGWISRIRGSDKREKKIMLTEQAHDKYENWLNAVRTCENGILTDISEKEMADMLAIIEKLKGNLN